MPPRSTRKSTYGPTASTATTLRRSRAALDIDALLQGQCRLDPCVRDRVDGGRRGGDRRPPRHAGRQRSLADQVPVDAWLRATVGGVYDQVAAAAPDQIDDARAVPRV